MEPELKSYELRVEMPSDITLEGYECKDLCPFSYIDSDDLEMHCVFGGCIFTRKEIEITAVSKIVNESYEEN